MTTEQTGTPIDVSRIRRDFPIFGRTVHGHPLVYLDSAATSQKPDVVVKAITRYYDSSNANVHRGVYLLAEEATELYEDSRRVVADFIGAASAEEIVFTRNATEAINLVAYTWARSAVGPGDSIVLTPEEHHSNFVPWQQVAAERGATVEFVELLPDGLLDMTSLEQILSSGRVKIVAVAGVSNVLGTINPLQEIVAKAQAYGARVLVDGAQLVPHLPVEVDTLGADFVAFTGHKMLGPMGIGALWARRSLLEEMPPFQFGGEMIRKVTEMGATWNDIPWKFEAGTPNVGGAVGMAAAIRYLWSVGMDCVRAHEQFLTTYALRRLSDKASVRVIGTDDATRRSGVIAFNVDGIHPHDLASIVDQSHGVCIRAGHHCAQPLHERLGLTASARASFYIYNDETDVDRLCDGIEYARSVMKVS